MKTTGTNTRHTNRLIDESSPYLLQHAHNPVDWFAWSDEAFEKARKENKPVFLSIGYSTCHWCHVMERESFENERIAAMMNEHFVNIKVDREQRPDVDEVYMAAVQMMTGSGGWPLSVFLTAEGRPFYGGTYFPPEDSFGRPGFDKVLLAVAEAWREDSQQILDSAEKINAALQEATATGGRQVVSQETLDRAYSSLAAVYDPVHSGFGSAPKFPQPSSLEFLLAFWYRSGNEQALEMVERTLGAMARGGICDQLGGGFHRYSTDEKWLVPHFEKMLNDQALLSSVYIKVYQITGKRLYAQLARQIFDYVLRDMTDKQGGFYSAEDADSEGVEGKFYVWTEEEIDRVLSKDEAGIFKTYCGVSEGGNLENGTNILSVKTSIEALAEKFQKQPQEIENILEGAREKLLECRSKRIRPGRDDKIITAWNGLMISSLACGGAVLGEQRYMDAAGKAADFVLSKLQSKDRLLRFYRDRRAVGPGFLDDYAFMTLALVSLYEATYDVKRLRQARRLAEQMIELFGDEKEGGFYRTAKDLQELIIRNKSSYDGAVPAGSSTAALALLKLGRMTMDRRFTIAAEKTLTSCGERLNTSPLSLTAMLRAVDFYLGPDQEIVVAGDIEEEDTKQMLRVLNERYMPRAVRIFHGSGGDSAEIELLVPFVKDQRSVDCKPAAHICEDYSCKAPVTDVEEFEKMLAELGR